LKRPKEEALIISMNSYPRRNRNRGGRMKIPSKEPKEKIE
jgi:hypothetical protein